MIRVNIHLTRKQVDSLQDLSNREGLPRSEIIRRAIDDYLALKQKEKNEH